MSETRISRGFVDLDHGQIHFREIRGASARPLVLIHPSPGSSKQLEPLLRALAAGGRSVWAPDTAGNGDSDALALAQPEIPDLARTALQAIKAQFEGPFHLYGSHTGASIAMEIALTRPELVASLTIEGMGLYDAGLQTDVLERYAREILPDHEATHLMKVWHFCRDQFVFWPYYNRTAGGRLPNGLPDAEDLHDFVVEVLKAMRTYHLSYRAAFRHPKRSRLPGLRVPVQSICSPSDMLFEYSSEVATLAPNARMSTLPAWSDPQFHRQSAGVIETFIREFDR
jgi:pimeloyl-ACP methyl ester carboxylesterase